MRQVLKEKADAAGVDMSNFATSFSDLKDDTTEIEDIEKLKSSQLKNLSLSLLSADHPKKVLDVFENEVIKKRQGASHLIFIEELCMLLHFMKA
jgi:hypothetical protein